VAEAQIAFRGAASAGVASGTAGAPTYIGATTVSGGGGDVTLPIPGVAQAGDLLLAIIAVEDENTGSITVPGGWTLIRGDNAGNHVQLTYYRVATAGDVAGSASWNWDWGGTEDRSAAILVFRGVDATTPIDAHNGAGTSTPNQATVNIPAITATVANTMLVAAVSVRTGATFGGWSGTLVERTDDQSGGGGNEVSHGSATRAGPAAGASSGAFTVTSSSNDTSRVGQLIALRPATASLTINRPPGTVSGDVMIASIVVRPSSVNITAPAGWAAQAAGLQNATGNSSRQQIFYRVAGGAEPASYTWLFDSAHTGAAGGIISFSGVDTAAPIDAYGGNLTPQGGDSNLQHRALAVTTTVADTMLVSTHSFTSADTWTPPTGMTERVDVASQGTPNGVGISLEMNSVLQPAAGTTGSKLATAAGNGDTGSATLLALRPLVVQPVLHWRLDELGWNGVANEVVDQSGNNLHGQAFNGATTGLVTPAISGSPGTCRYGGFDGNTQFVQVADNALLDITDELTVMMWLRPTAYATAGNLKSFVSKDQNYEAHLTSTGTINWWWGGNPLELNSAGTVPLNQWTHVALVYSRAGAFQRIYRNGVLDGTNNQNGALVTNNLPFQIASDQGFAGRNFAGLIDEVYVFRSALSAARIAQYMNATRVCATQINHFSISHSGSGVGCVDQPITFTAHDLTHANVDANGLLVNLSTTNAQGTWTGVLAGGGVLNDPDPGNGTATYQFPLGGNSVTLMFRYASLTGVTETFGFNISGGGFSEVGGVANASDDPAFTMAQAGFRVRNIEDANEIVPTQISGKPSNTGWNARTLRVQAINTNTSNGSCSNLFASQAQVVLLGGECNNPAACAARQLNVNGTNLATSNSNGGAGAAAYTGVNLNFNANSEADIVLTYADAGQISLHAQFDLNPLVAGNEMIGSSNNFVVRPLGLAMPGINHSSTATGTLIGAAGDAFAMTVQGFQWAPGEDANNDGIPDAGANLTNNGTVPNFAGTATLGVTANLPGTAPGALNRGAGCVGAPSVALAGGFGTANDWCYSEVGNVLLSATVPDYLGSGVSVTGGSAFDGDVGGGYIGRFKPKYFAVSGTPSLTNRSLLACASTFTYLGERLSLGFTLEARNTAGAVTQNYNGAYAKLNLASAASLGIGARSGATNLTARVDPALAPTGSFASGVAALTVPFAVRRPTPDVPDGPFAGTQFGIAANDADPDLATGVQMGSFNQDVDGVGGNDHVSVGPTTALRFGWLRVENDYGSVNVPLPITLEARYWNGAAFAVNTLDGCTSINRSDIAMSFTPPSNLNACETALTQSSFALAAGRATMMLAPPGAGNSGSVLLTPNLGTAAGTYCPAVGVATAAATASPAVYLLGRWDDVANPDANPNTSYDDKPRGRAAYGLYGSQPRNFIFFRENY
jgi:MSHA biogenesis protein MshQ